jgi:hypothetical protein
MGGQGSGRKTNDARRRTMARLRDRGLSVAEIGRRLGVTKQNVSATLGRMGYADAAGARTELLFGPSTPPDVQRGDRARCLYRDSEVVITGWTDARIPWPRCHPGKRGGGAGLLVDEELAHAVCHESAAAIMYWWGVGVKAVWAWRKALGVGRADNEGTARLVQAAAEKGAEAVKAREWSDEERARCARRATELNLIRHAGTGYKGPRWTKAQVRLLGTMPDEDMAAKVGRSPNAVRLMRTRRGISTFRDRRERENRS